MPYFNNRPGMMDEGFINNLPNISPAGEAPWLKNNPMLTLPEGGDVRPEWNSVWLNPGMLMEPGSGFGSEGRSSALQMMDFPFLGFSFPGFPPTGQGFGPGPYGISPPQAPSQQNPAGETDFLGAAIKAGSSILKGLTPTTKVSTFMGPEATNQAMQDVWGFSPADNPNFTLAGPENAGVQYPPDTSVAPGINSPLLPPAWDVGVNPGILSNSPLFGAAPGPAMGFGAEPGVSLFGTEGASTLTPDMFSLGANPTLSTASNPALLSSGTAAGLGAALAAAPPVLNQFGQKDAARFVGSPAMSAPAGVTLAALAGASPATLGLSMVAVPALMSIMKGFDIGGASKRKATDAQALNDMMTGMDKFLSIARFNPELLNKTGNWAAFNPIDRLKEIMKNNRVGQESPQFVGETYNQWDPIRQQILEGQRPDLSRTNVTPLSEGELWRLQQVEEQRRFEQEQAKLAEIARQQNIYEGR